MTKKEKIEQTARELFLKHGFKKVSVDEICRKAEVSRKTFYTYFENKNSLVLAILKEMTGKMLVEFKNLINNTSLSFPEKMQEMMALKFEYNKDFSMEFVGDFLHPDAVEILEFFNRIVADSIQLTREFFQNAQLKGEMNPAINIDFLMWNMQKQLEICSTSEALAMFQDAQSMTKQLSELIIYGIFSHSK